MRISFDGIQVEDCPVAVGQPGDTFQQIICRKAIQYGCIRVFNLFAIFINRGTQPESIVFTEIFECRVVTKILRTQAPKGPVAE